MNLKRNIIAIYGAYLINGILSIVVIPLGLRQMGSDGYGLFAIYGVLSQCCMLLGMGYNKHFTRLLASDREPRTQIAYLRIALALYLTVSLILLICLPILCLIIPVFLFPVSSPDVWIVRWLIVLVVIEYILTAPTEMMQIFCIANERIDRYARYSVISGIYRYGLMFLGILAFGSPLITVALVVARRLIDPFVAYRILGKLPFRVWHPHFDFIAFRSFIRGSALLSLSQITHVVMLSLGSVLANAFCGLSGLGLYRAAFDLSSRLWLISNGLGLVIFPRFSHLLAAKEQSARILERIPEILDLSWVGYLTACTIGIWIAPFLLPLIGLQTDTIQLFMLLLLGTGMNAHSNLSYEFLQAGGKYFQTTLVVCLGTIAMGTTFVFLHVNWGTHALGWAWIISQFTYAISIDIGTEKLLGNSLKSIIRQVTFKLFIALAAVSLTIINLSASGSGTALVPAIIFLIILAIAVQYLGGRIKPSSLESQHAC